MSDQSKAERFASISEGLKHLAEIVALIVAGVWTYDKFIRTEEPLINGGGRTDHGVAWTNRDGMGNCKASFRVSFENGGNGTVTVHKVHLQGWTYPKPQTTGSATLFVPEAVPGSKKILDTVLSSGTLVHEYPPKAKYWADYDVLLAAPPKGSYATLRADVFVDDTTKRESPLNESWWGPVCNEAS